MHPLNILTNIKVGETKFACRLKLVSATLAPHANLVSITFVFFLGYIPIHAQELFSGIITFFNRVTVSEIHILHSGTLIS